ncbi:hypothetical protein Hena1_01690 [Erwinia phage Hena1]|uniref:Uncharacterized protein n=1 Tax=Erwinia phage Hena1 TaxID=2678601 RepID=A0A6B9J9W8_9CAUD|nr:hypothetical protein HWC84_gp195 [Erwinia phage Hena1]QGZ16319.1 hypothetical protein Hena1_01690 [Erwinia phage Hena1]
MLPSYSVDVQDAAPRLVTLPDGTVIDLTAQQPAGQGPSRLSVLLGKIMTQITEQQKQINAQNVLIEGMQTKLEAIELALHSDGEDADYAAQVTVIKNYLATRVVDRLNTLEQSMFRVAAGSTKQTTLIDYAMKRVDMGDYMGFFKPQLDALDTVAPKYEDYQGTGTPVERTEADKLITG